MSTTAQDTPLPGTTAEEAAEALTEVAAAAPAAAAPRASADVEYILFEETRTDTYTQLTTVRAKSPEAAMESLGEAKLKTLNGRLMVVPSRYVTQKKPNITTVTTISFD